MARVFSGVQPTGNLHLGNYLGAIRNFVRLQDDNECLYCVVDMHAITVWQDPKELARNTREVAAAFLAAGIDPKTNILFNQSRVPQHAELAWIFKFNNDFGTEFFPLVEPLIQGEAARVMSLRDGSSKMSKSDPSDNSRINMTDDADTIAKKIRRARTDPEPVPDGTEALGSRASRPEAFNLLEIFAALSDRTVADVQAEYGGQQFSAFKEALTEIAVGVLGPMGAEMKRLVDDPTHVDAVLSDAGARARAIAEPILKDVYDIVGFLRD